MAYTLHDFCIDCRSVLMPAAATQHEAGRGDLPNDTPAHVAELLARLLANPELVAAIFRPDDAFVEKLLYADPDLGFQVVAHVHLGPSEGVPHSHGASWAVYGTAMGVTAMTEWQRAEPPGSIGAVLEPVASYDLEPGETRVYGPHQIHSTRHAAKTWAIRVAGCDLGKIECYRFDPKRDQLAGRRQ